MMAEVTGTSSTLTSANNSDERRWSVRLYGVALLVWILGSAPSFGAEPPSVRETLEMLGYKVVKRGSNENAMGKLAVEIDLPPATQLRVVSTKIETPLVKERDTSGPWISLNEETRYGVKDLSDRDVRIETRTAAVVLDARGQLIKRIEGGAAMSLSKGQPTDFTSSTGAELNSSLPSGLVAWAVLGRESENVRWQLLSYNTFWVDRLE